MFFLDSGEKYASHKTIPTPDDAGVRLKLIGYIYLLVFMKRKLMVPPKSPMRST